MGQSFDPYYKWLGIAPEEQPPNHYRLLGVRNFEADPDVLQAAADQRMAHLRTYQTSRHAELSQRLLNEVAAAKICLLNPAKKTAYDEQLRESLAPAETSASSAAIVVDEPRPRRSSSFQPKRQGPGSAIIAGGMILLAVVVGLAYWTIGSHEPPVVAAKTTAESTRRQRATGTQAEKPRAVAGAKEGNLNGKAGKTDQRNAEEQQAGPSVPTESENKKFAPAVVPSPSEPTPVVDSPSENNSQAKSAPKADSEAPPPEAASRGPMDAALPVPAPLGPKSQAPQHAGVPSYADIDEAMKTARNLYKDDFAKAKTPEEKQAVAKKLLTQAEGMANSDAGTFALLELAKDLSVQAWNSEIAMAAIDAMSARYALDGLELKAEVLAGWAKRARTSPQHLSVSEQAARLLDEATAAGNYVQAVALAKLAAAEAGRAQNKELALWAKGRLQDLQKKAKVAADFESARNTLAAEPDDPAANLIAGTYYGCLQGDWEKALPHFAKGSDADLQAVAQQELASPPAALDAQLALADSWWDAGQNADGIKRLALLRHAGMWYRKAQTGSPGGLNKIKIEKRLAELAQADRDMAVAGAGSRVSVPLGKWFPLLTSANEMTGWDVGICRFSYANRIIDLRGQEMYCPIVAKDVTLRAKVKRHDPSCVRLILRHSDQGCYVAQLTNNQWSIVKRTHRGAKEDTLKRVPVTRHFSDVVFEIGFEAAGDMLTVFLNRQPLLQAKDAALTEGAVGIGTDNSTGLFVSDIELLIPKGSFVADHRNPIRAVKP